MMRPRGTIAGKYSISPADTVTVHGRAPLSAENGAGAGCRLSTYSRRIPLGIRLKLGGVLDPTLVQLRQRRRHGYRSRHHLLLVLRLSSPHRAISQGTPRPEPRRQPGLSRGKVYLLRPQPELRSRQVRAAQPQQGGPIRA